MPPVFRIGIDAGGTFTDFAVARPDGTIETFKLPSNPADPASVILRGIALASKGRKAAIVHGSTVATNALLERKGARTAFLTTAGFADLLAIGRQNRAELYNLNPPPKRLLIAPADCHNVLERTTFDGEILRAPTRSAIQSLRAKLKRSGVESVAICFLHGWQTPRNEQLVADWLKGAFYLSVSHEIAPEFREFERASTTAVNAYVGPLMDSYLGKLERHAKVSVMQSNGGLMPASMARRHAVRTILSGPAGGAVGAMGAASASGLTRILGFDMGGTSTDVCLCDGSLRETTEATIDGIPVRVPMLDIHTVGAGGGSIARIDAGGLLRVGPESAGADPGPACYGKEMLPTVTDAQVVLGRVSATQLAGGALTIQPERSREAIGALAKLARLSLEAMAAGVLRVADANMERAIRTVSVERGFDPRDFALAAFGGGGGLHACELAAHLGMRRVIVPNHAGVLSAIGMLMANPVRDYAAAALGRTDFERIYSRLARQARKDMPSSTHQRFSDTRYAGQSYEITIPWGDDFHAAHRRQYGFDMPDRPTETVTLRLRATAQAEAICLRRPPRTAATGETRRIFVDGHWRAVRVLRRPMLSNRPIIGPLLIVDDGATTLVPHAWRVRCDAAGNLLLSRGAY